ncbi:hypothetical protein CDL15_Pgr012414 [Punica granatum]|uniref:Uncharacterized protein n=1 Tax=Punica granatum TaxID=22663 RepID=A0A218X059_PUNGR|nr:hypothetical protein CDL15_Pgr012414 [Punica granatum]
MIGTWTAAAKGGRGDGKEKHGMLMILEPRRLSMMERLRVATGEDRRSPE